MLNPKSYKLKSVDGYAAMFSFLVMLTVFATLIVAFTAIAVKNIFTARVFSVDVRNTYANEGFIEDAIRRAKDSGLQNVTDGETLSFNDITVTAVLYDEDTVKNYVFSASAGGKFFKREMLTVENADQSSFKIKGWRETQ
jgi:hypothetical protein